MSYLREMCEEIKIFEVVGVINTKTYEYLGKAHGCYVEYINNEYKISMKKFVEIYIKYRDDFAYHHEVKNCFDIDGGKYIDIHIFTKIEEDLK